VENFVEICLAGKKVRRTESIAKTQMRFRLCAKFFLMNQLYLNYGSLPFDLENHGVNPNVKSFSTNLIWGII
jgi:hypothetical protein